MIDTHRIKFSAAVYSYMLKIDHYSVQLTTISVKNNLNKSHIYNFQ